MKITTRHQYIDVMNFYRTLKLMKLVNKDKEVDMWATINHVFWNN